MSYDDQLQSVRFEGIIVGLICLEPCASEAGTTIDVEGFFCNERKTKRGTSTVFGKKKRKSLESLAQCI